ncbi:hypothetical protein GALL_161500 [mine drainage metagenome]|uniref:Uncharacterized protein n=1 Tax=mine drainage metagenome TaxID=410659 RepID=A0A1J5SCR9_9ZZZZ
MNSYAQYLARAAEEIRIFAASKDGSQWGSQWYEQISDLTEKTRAASTDEAAERYLDMLLWCIVDSGPLGKGFAPSIDIAADAMQRKRKRQFKERCLSKEHR